MNIVSTHGFSINLAKSYLNKELWIALGGGSLTWADNTNPPLPSMSINKFTDLIGLLYIDIKRLVSKDPTGSIKTNNGSYTYASNSLSTEQLIERQAYYLYLEATVEPFSNLEGQKVTLIGLAENVVLNNSNNFIRKKHLYIPSEAIVDYDLTLVSAVPEMYITSQQKFQFVRRF